MQRGSSISATAKILVSDGRRCDDVFGDPDTIPKSRRIRRRDRQRDQERNADVEKCILTRQLDGSEGLNVEE